MKEGKSRAKRGRAAQSDSSTPERGGFALEFDAVGPIIHATMSGFWDVTVAQRFRAEILAMCARVGGKKWSALVDSRTFLAQTPDVTRHRQETMILIMNEGCKRIAAIVSENGTYAMQFARIASEVGVANATFLDPALALDWVRNDLDQSPR
ncbi:MAG: hypothetical protein ABSF69_17065 [Polyangiaceae bacterium]|jgi:hypothetical protein